MVLPKGKLHISPLLRMALVLALLCAVSGCDMLGQTNTTQPQGYDLKVYMLDVGQGDSILLASGGEYMLVDAGENDKGDTVVSDLRRLGVKKLTAAVGTHPHSDHIGGMDTVLKTFPVDTLYLSPKTENTETYEDVLDAADAKGLSVTVPKPGDTMMLGTAELEFLWPAEGYDSKNENNCSVVILVSAGGHKALLCGDIEKEAEKELLDSGLSVDCDMLKVAHHGSDTSSTKAFLKAASPQYAIISVGRNNDYKHPDKDVLGRLINAGAEIHRTDLEGTITVTFENGEITVDSNK
jgi:competence protein ComEC